MEKGVVIIAMRKPHYACAAFNLALSIKHHSPNIHITLVSDGVHNKAFQINEFSRFDFIKELKETSVAEAKLNVHKYVDYKQTLYLDADTLCLKDINPLFDKLSGEKFKSNQIDNYTQWTSEEAFKKFFKLDFGVTINSSFIYFENGKVFDQANKYFKKGFDKLELTENWGGHLPDEMFFNAALTKLEINPKTDFDVMYLDDKKREISFGKLVEDYYFITYYGNRQNTRLEYQEYYDKCMFRMCDKLGIEHKFKLGDIMAHKLITEK